MVDDGDVDVPASAERLVNRRVAPLEGPEVGVTIDLSQSRFGLPGCPFS